MSSDWKHKISIFRAIYSSLTRAIYSSLTRAFYSSFTRAIYSSLTRVTRNLIIFLHLAALFDETHGKSQELAFHRAVKMVNDDRTILTRYTSFTITSKNIRWWSLLILVLSVASIRRKLLKTTHSEERSVHTNSESCNI